MITTLRQKVRLYKRQALVKKLHTATGVEIKQANANLNWREYWHQQTTLQSKPRTMQIGTNWTCNLKCNFCLLTEESTQSRLKALPPRELQISDKVLQAVLELMPYPERISLTPLGEPVLYSKFGLFLERHAQAGSRNLAMTSNGNLITSDRAKAIVEAGMSQITFSVDSCDPEVYASMRVGGNLPRAEEGINHINNWKEKLQRTDPILTLASTFMERNVRQMPLMVDFALKHKFHTYGVQLMDLEPHNPLLPEFLGNHLELTKEMVLETLRRAEGKPLQVHINLALKNLLSNHLSSSEKRSLNNQGTIDRAKSDESFGQEGTLESINTKGQHLLEKCHYPWYFLLVDTNGDCRPCCWTGMSFGNLNDRGFDEIWNSKAAVKMRQDFLENKIPKACQEKHCRVDLDHHGSLE
ncbi:MAG: radical SAM/SPASM domain-containing protein [Sumerlaeia bacterium]